MRQRVHDFELHHAIGQQPQTPLRATFRWCGTGQPGDVSLDAAIDFGGLDLTLCPFQDSQGPAFECCLFPVGDGSFGDVESLCDFRIGPPRDLFTAIDLQQSLCESHFPGRDLQPPLLSTSNRFELLQLLFRERDDVLDRHVIILDQVRDHSLQKIET